jgi:hypothetical protein
MSLSAVSFVLFGLVQEGNFGLDFGRIFRINFELTRELELF